MKHLATIIILTVTLNSFGQYQFDGTKISARTKQIVVKIAKENSLMGSAVSDGAIRPKQFDNFTELQRIATKSELRELTNYPNGVVRCYSFWALTYDTTTHLLPILIKHISDSESISTMFGCIVSKDKAGDFFYSLATPENLTTAEFEYLDSLLIYTPNNLGAKENAISRAKQSETFYTRARQLVLNENNQSALVALAKFKREQDTSLILNNNLKDNQYGPLFFTYKAISEFPNTAFLPLLKKSLYEAIDETHWSTEWSEMYKAIASFRNDTALQLLKIPFTQVKHQNIRQYHINFIFKAVQDFYTPAYDELLWEMWEKEKEINTNVFNLLYPQNPEKGFQLTKNTIRNAGDFYYLSSGNNDIESPVNLLDVMLDTILIHERDFAVELINKNIREINVHQFPLFADKAVKLKDTSFITSLFTRLETESNPHIYLKATAVLIALNDAGINNRIIEVSKRNPSLRKGWGGESFSKMLKENKLLQ